MTHEEEIREEVFFTGMDRVGTARFEGKPYFMVSLRGTSIWDTLSSHGRENTVKFLLEGMKDGGFLRDVIIDAAIDHCKEYGVPEDRRPVDIHELLMRVDETKCPI